MVLVTVGLELKALSAGAKGRWQVSTRHSLRLLLMFKAHDVCVGGQFRTDSALNLLCVNHVALLTGQYYIYLGLETQA